jgi:hypothetical protein
MGAVKVSVPQDRKDEKSSSLYLPFQRICYDDTCTKWVEIIGPLFFIEEAKAW